MVCNRNSETTVWAHENSYQAGKGIGLKAKDKEGCYACSTCHATYDGQMKRPAWLSKDEVDAYFQIGKEVSRLLLIQQGFLCPHGMSKDEDCYKCDGS